MNNRIGERFRNRDDLGGYEFVIIEYNKYSDVLIEFQDEYKAIVPTQYSKCLDGGIKNPYHPSVYGVGYLGVGKYKSRDEQGNKTDYYEDWHSILQRGFDEKYKNKRPTYKDVTINPELYNFQNFAEWWHNNYYEIEGEMMDIDKDIIVKGNKEYRFDRMIFVPHRINSLFVKNDAKRGNYPLGVSYSKQTNTYRAKCSILNKEGKRIIKHIGCYNSPEEAFLAYKEFKEQYIKQVADEYKDKIPKELYDAMYRWEVEIDD